MPGVAAGVDWFDIVLRTYSPRTGYGILLVLTLFSFNFLVSNSVFQPIKKFTPLCIEAGASNSYTIYSNDGFYSNGKKLNVSPILRIDFKKGKLFINGQLIIEKNVEIMPENGSFTLQGQRYKGSVYLLFQDKAWHLFQYQKKDVEHNSSTKKDRKYHVRVLLAEYEKKNLKKPIQLHSKKGFILYDPHSGLKDSISGSVLNVVYAKKRLLINGKNYNQKQLFIFPLNEFISFEDREYHGYFLLAQDAQKLQVINVLDIEDYVVSVLRTESWPGWPLEVNKVFAIASRSYVIGVILDTKNCGLSYHVKNTNKHQTYTGIHKDLVLKDAVEQTKGLFLSYNNKPIVAMFDSCCGGIIPAKVHGINFTHAPYLARSYACTFCKDCRVYSWQAEYSKDQLESILRKEFSKLKRLKDIHIIKNDKAGLVQELQAKTPARNYHISGKRIYSLLDKVKSFYFSVFKKDSNTFVFSGKGIGHHMGLCQWGAREMVRIGHDFKSILQFYYPETQLMRLS